MTQKPVPVAESHEELHEENVAPAEIMADDSANTTESMALHALQTENAELKDRLLRALAESENLRRRAQKEAEDARKFAAQSFARDLLSVADNFERALGAMQEATQIGDVLAGVTAVEREMAQIFQRHGIERLDPLHLPFDPNLHEALFEAAHPEHATGTVLQVIQPGYTLNGRLLRPARVGVVKNTGQTRVDTTA